uniref:Uncharacterized protein n=1 Tax=Streptomyces sp. NBC_00003 TaxID=2903608 RepID=A0AAU2V7S9_9ACTN
MSDQMAWAKLYELALETAEKHGATIPDAARHVGAYGFFDRVTHSDDGWSLTWNGKPA